LFRLDAYSQFSNVLWSIVLPNYLQQSRTARRGKKINAIRQKMAQAGLLYIRHLQKASGTASER